MTHIAETELQQLIGHDTGSIAEPEQTMISEDGMQTHCPRMQYALVAKVAEGAVSMHDLDLLPDEDLSHHREGGEDRRKGGGAVYDPVWEVVDLDTVGEVADSGTAGVGVGYYYYAVAAVY
jgi:hypothetical protein